jgi:signal peptidase II
MKDVPANRLVIFGSLAVSGCAADLATKHWIFAKLGMPREQPPIWLWDNIFGLETSLNEGALFGIGQGQVALFATLSVAAAIGVFYWLFYAGAARDLMLTIALGAVTAGVFGNLYDRLGLPRLTWTERYSGRGHVAGDPVYAVRDWLHFKVDAWNFDWPVFNVADSLLVCGAGLLILHALRYREPERLEAAQRRESASASQS